LKSVAQCFAFLSKKGGVGKTTFTLNCAHALAFSGYKTLLIDIDGQANLSRHLLGKHLETPEAAEWPDMGKVLLNRTAAPESILETGYANLDLISGSSSLDDLPTFDPRLLREPARLKNALEPLQGVYDFILFDCPPSVNWLTRMALVTCQSVIVPVQAEPYALQGLRDLIPLLDRMTATAQLFKIVINMYRQNTGLHQTILKEIETAYPGRVAKQKVRLTIQLAEAAREGLSVFEYAPASIGALDMYALCFELFHISPEQVKAFAQNRNVASPDAAALPPMESVQAEVTAPQAEEEAVEWLPAQTAASGEN
jgi:chromosome partitioning protein